MSSCLQTLSKVAKVKVLIQQCGVCVFHKILLSFFMLTILPKFFQTVKTKFRIFLIILFFLRYQTKKVPDEGTK